MNKQNKVGILMVDDQPAKLLSYEAILNDLDENLIKASSGREALEHLLRKDIAVVLMDVSMPELDGFELAEIIRQHPRFQKTAILFISAVHLTDIDRIKGYERGAVDYISVPVVPEVLKAKVSVFAELHRKTKQLEAMNEELRVLSGRLLTVQDDERRRFARELHDGLGQELAAAKLMIDSIAQMPSSESKNLAATQCSSALGRVLQQVRSISYLLHPPLLDEGGLRTALQWYVDGLSERGDIVISIGFEPNDFPRLSHELETAIFRIIQGALSNIMLHSEARNANVMLLKEERQITVRVCDDGKGISEAVLSMDPGSLGVGIGGMRQRVKEFGGDLKLRNARPGTVVEALIPICG
jgi:signal transduction histidine kinase